MKHDPDASQRINTAVLEGAHSNFTPEQASTHLWCTTSLIKPLANATLMNDSVPLPFLSFTLGGQLSSDQIGLSGLGKIVNDSGPFSIH